MGGTSAAVRRPAAAAARLRIACPGDGQGDNDRSRSPAAAFLRKPPRPGAAVRRRVPAAELCGIDSAATTSPHANWLCECACRQLKCTRRVRKRAARRASSLVRRVALQSYDTESCAPKGSHTPASGDRAEGRESRREREVGKRLAAHAAELTRRQMVRRGRDDQSAPRRSGRRSAVRG
jgi:hypothetical protein